MKRLSDASFDSQRTLLLTPSLSAGSDAPKPRVAVSVETVVCGLAHPHTALSTLALVSALYRGAADTVPSPLPVWGQFFDSHACESEMEVPHVPTRTACTVQTLELLCEVRCRLHEHFMRDGRLSPDEHAILHLHDETSYWAERADYGRRALIALVNYTDVEPTTRQQNEWRELELLRDRIYVGHAPSPVAAG